MYGFLIKKSFCDDWDNLLTVFLVNAIYVLAILGAATGSAGLTNIFSAVDEIKAYQVVILAAIALFTFFVMNIIAFAFGELSAKIADFNGTSIIAFFKEIPGVLKDAILFSLMVLAITFISGFSIYFYMFASGSRIGLFVGALLFWIDVLLVLSLQWFIPLRSLMHNDFGKCLKKCFIIFFDNTGFSILVFLHTVLMTVLSIFPFFGIFPGIAGIEINKANALRIRMYKYDYLEEHPELKTKKERKNIPWEELIFEDREILGPRKLRSFLFPWKEEK